MKKIYKILLLSNKENKEYYTEDTWLSEAFIEDGHTVEMKWIDYDESLDEDYDIIIRRNAWVGVAEKTNEYKVKNDILIQRLNGKKIKTVNLEGIDGRGKKYLCELFDSGKRVIPSVNNIRDLYKFGETPKEYVLKENNSFGSSIRQKIIKASEIDKEFEEGHIIQPKLQFKSEVQTYFVGNKLMYAYEYIPNKYPNYPKPIKIELSNKEKELAYEFAKIINHKIGFARIDFLRLPDDELILLELEDNSPVMDLEELDIEERKTVLEEYKRNVYQFLKE